MNKYTIAIDGPAGAGKSTIAKNVARKLNILHLDTGAMYRAVGLFSILNNVDSQNEKAVTEMMEDIDIDIKYTDGKQETLLNGEDVTSKIRNMEVSNAASTVSKWPVVRKRLVTIQQDVASRMSIVMDGRDIGTYVMPDAKYKFYLTASVEQRANRRHIEIKNSGRDTTIEKVIEEIASRDYQDMNRDFAPLTKAADALEIDTTKLTINEVLEIVYGRLGI